MRVAALIVLSLSHDRLRLEESVKLFQSSDLYASTDHQSEDGMLC